MDANKIAQDFLTWNSFKLSPYDPRKNKPQDVGLGGVSTEYLATVDAPEGGYRNIPTIWFNPQGRAQLIDEDVAVALSDLNERFTGRKFPRYPSIDSAVQSAEARSRNGGAERLSLLDFADQIRRYGSR